MNYYLMKFYTAYIRNHLPKHLRKILSCFMGIRHRRKKAHDLKVLKYSENKIEQCRSGYTTKIMNYIAKKKSIVKYKRTTFKQELVFFNIISRINLFEYYCKGKKVLHVGCTDYPIFDPEGNLHIYLSKLASELHGVDLDIEGLNILKKYVDQPYYNSLSDVTDFYDVCLIPEVIEHVDNISLFLKDIEKIDAQLFIITAPNAFGKFYRNLNFFRSGHLSFEFEHPDHNCYFSPYTLKNTIQKYSCMEVKNIFLTNQQHSVVCICRKIQAI